MRLLTLISTMVLVADLAVGQTEGYNVPKIEDLVKIPPSPEAQAFAKYGNVPMNLNTGTASVGVPIHTIQGDEMEIPISLTYDASGIKVEQIATWAGLGWNLTLGGMITRQVRGAPDDYLTATPSYTTYYGSSAVNDYNFVNGFNAVENQNYPPGALSRYFNFMTSSLAQDRGTRVEIQPDVFSLSAIGLSGTIFVNYQTNSAYSMEHPELKITPFFQAATDDNKVITNWMIVDGAGNTYYFDTPEVTSVEENNSYDGAKVYNSAWALTKIVTKTRKDTFEFGVGAASWSQPKLAGRSAYRVDLVSNNTNCGSDQMPFPGDPTYTITQLETSGITHNGKGIISIATKSRSDLSGKSAIDYIRINDLEGNQIRKIKLIHSYFGDPINGENGHRLKLDKVEIYGSSDAETPEVYTFTYNGPELPNRESFSQDFWGYYNGKPNGTLIPYNYTFDKANWINHFWKGANRNTDLAFAVAGSLASVQYPTGGSTTLTYDLHGTSQVAFVEQEYQQFGFFGLTGGTQASNTYNYCDDMIPTPPFPKGTSGTFTIPQTGYYDIKMIWGTEGNFVPGMEYAAIYQIPPEDCDGSGNCVLKNFCELFQPGGTIPEWTFYGSLGGTNSSTTEKWLTAGTYGYLALNSDIHVNFNVEVWGAPAFDRHTAGGLRVVKTEDRDEYGALASAKYYYYGDLSLLPDSLLNPAYLELNHGQNGELGDPVNFEETKFADKPDLMQPTAPIVRCYTTTRMSANKVQSDVHVAYPVVSTIEFNSLGQSNGFEVSEFAPSSGTIQTDIYSHGGVLTGKLLKKRIYDRGRVLKKKEESFYTQRSIDVGVVNGFSCRISSSVNTNLDMYVKSPLLNPSNQFYAYEETTLSFNGGAEGNSFSETHCAKTGELLYFFSYEHCDGSMICKDQVFQSAAIFAAQNDGNSPADDETFEKYVVSVPTYNIILCSFLGGVVEKIPYSFPRRWASLDKTVTTTYDGGEHVATVDYYYDNLNHYQVTRIETTGSNGIPRKIEKSYAHDLQIAEPANPIWSTLVTQNRIMEPFQIKGTYASGSPDFMQKTVLKPITVASATVYVPDKVQISSGASALEDRVFYHQYDANGNILEVSRSSDARVSYLWGYENTLPVANVKNASSNEIFFTSFEYGPDLGNSTLGDSHCGTRSSLTGINKTLTGLTTTKSYLLSYWKKVSGVWTYYSVTVSSGITSYLINLSGQIDDVRFHPIDAQMTTYTHKPQVGLTSTSDVNNQPTYYEYDTQGRLYTVRDFQGNILRQYKYHFRSGAIPASQQGTQP
ncbi:MAG: hypothetical protein JNN04_09515 [Cyclobacteriaceae bacterium]|nr:hypothetical protein [Cyclobacteriaceae bacterium]